MKKFLVFASILLMLTACQSTNDTVENHETVEDAPTVNQEQVESYGTPFSVGPSGPPEATIKGPTSAPPSSTSVGAQAVTTTEDIRLTLPRKTD